MATGNVVLTVLDVGQGQGTFVEIYDTAGTLLNTLLFDLGSAKGSKTAGVSSIDYVATKVASMATPKIDYMSLSHKDRDHVNLIKALIDAINAKITPKTLVIGMVRYGGAKSWYSADLIKYLEGICPDVNSLNLRHCCYDKAKKVYVPIWNQNSVFVYIILANIPTDEALTDWSQINVKDKPDSELANSVSIISSVYYSNCQFFICGDATFVTLEESNKIFSFLKKFDKTIMVTMPHHGSRKTTLGLSSSMEVADDDNIDVVETFAQKISAQTVTSSAEIFGNYHHPSLDVMELFNKFTNSATIWSDSKLDAGRHYVTAYLDVTLNDSAGKALDDQYSSFETKMNVYSTLYCEPGYIGVYLCPPKTPVSGATTWKAPKVRPAFPVGVRWTYTITAAGKATLTQSTSRIFLAAPLADDAAVNPATEVREMPPRLQLAEAARAAFPLQGLQQLRPALAPQMRNLAGLKVFR